MEEISRTKLLEMIQKVMRDSKQVIRCEDQLKLALAWELKKFCDDKANIYLEYAAKNTLNGGHLYYDIVTEIGSEYIPIELKFKTKSIKNFEYSNHAAQNLGRYDFWADVERIQNFKANTGKTLMKGYAILVTNDSVYREKSGEGFMYENFSTKDERELHEGETLIWTEKPNHDVFNAVGVKRKRGIAIKNNYTLNWDEIMTLTKKIKFETLILEVM